jgi:hypothetical protein
LTIRRSQFNPDSDGISMLTIREISRKLHFMFGLDMIQHTLPGEKRRKSHYGLGSLFLLRSDFAFIRLKRKSCRFREEKFLKLQMENKF